MTTTLITGATDGIGLELANIYHAAGHRLLLIGRKPLTALQQLDSSLFVADNYIEADLAKAACCTTICQALDRLNIDSLDLVIQNAGVGYVGDIGNQSAKSIEIIITVNLITPIKLTHALLPRLLKASGKLVFISSVVTAIPSPQFAVYAASKAALDGFARSLRVELASKIAVQVIHPGATKTGMHAKVGMAESQYRHFPSAEKVSRKISRAIASQRRSVTIGVGNKLIGSIGPLIQPYRRASQPGKPTIAQPHVVITGAADGIGKALALRYLQAGYRVTGVDVDAQRAAVLAAELALEGCPIEFVISDLASGDYAWLEQINSADIFIHNAGISASGPFASLDPAQQEQVLRVNLLAPLQITAHLLAEQKLSYRSTVILLSSLSHFVSYPAAATYAATKDGLTHYARSLGAALKPNGSTLTVFPGPTRTAHASRYAPDNKNAASRMAPALLADKIFAAQQAGRRKLLPSASSKLFATLGLFFPRLMEAAMRRTIFDKFPPE